MQVQNTNDYSTQSKCSTAMHGYFKDEFLSVLMPFNHRRSPLIHMGYFVRVKVLDRILNEFMVATNGRPAQIISCGAGFDSTFFRLKASEVLHSGIVYYEIDFRDVIEKKAARIHQSGELTKYAGELAGHPDVGFGGDKYWLLVCDLCNLSALEEKMIHANVDFSLPTLFLAECSITYMDEQSSSALIRWAANLFRDATFVTYEQVCPDDGFGLVMQKHFENQGNPLQSLSSYPDLEAQEKRYLTRGWTVCYARSAWDVYFHSTTRADRHKVQRIEGFDEFEEWILKCNHYAVIVASKGQLGNWMDGLLGQIQPPSSVPLHRPVTWDKCEVKSSVDPKLGSVHRFGHGTSVITMDEERRNRAIVVVGGFGVTSGGHKRIEQVCLLTDLPSKKPNKEVPESVLLQCHVYNTDEEKVCLNAMYPSCTVIHHNKSSVMARILLYGGRLSPWKGVNVEGNLLNIPFAQTMDNISVTATPLAQPGTMWDRPRSRWRHTAIQIPPGDSQPWARVLIYGGKAPNSEVYGDLWLVTIATEVNRVTFRRLETIGNVPTPRFSHSAAALQKRIGMVVSGGLDQDIQPLADVWLYDFGEKQWRKVQFEGPGMLPRFSHTSTIYQDMLILVGGVNSTVGCQPGVAVINLKTRRCTEYTLPVQDPEYPILLHNHSMESLTEDNSVQCLVGGGGNCFSFGTSYNQFLLRLDLQQFLQCLQET